MSLNIKNYISYGMGDLFCGGAFTLIGTFFMVYLTDHVGLPAWLAGFVFGGGRVLLGLMDPFIGNLSDNVRSRFGRRRIFFVMGFSFLPIMVTFIPLWINPIKVLPDQSNIYIVFLYYLVMYCLFDIVYSSLEAPYSALAADMSHEYKDRIYLSGFRMGFSQLSSILSTSVAPLILISLAYSKEAYLIMAISFSIFYSIVWIVVFLGTKEIPVTYIRKRSKNIYTALFSFIKNFFSTFKNKTFRVHLVIYLCAFSSLDFIMTLSAYFFNVYLNNSDLIQWIFVIWTTQLISLPFYIYIARQKSMAKAYRIGAIIWVLAMFFALTLTPNNSSDGHVILTFILIGLGLSPCYVMPMMMLSFVTEVDVLLNGQRRTGIYVGAMSLSRKLSQGAIILPGIGLFLSLVHYDASSHIQEAFTVSAVHWVYIFLPVILICIGFLASLKFHINRKNFKYLREEVTRLENGDFDYSSCSITRSLCEKVTNRKYTDLIDNWKHQYAQNYIN